MLIVVEGQGRRDDDIEQECLSIVSWLWNCLQQNLKISLMIHCTGKSLFKEILQDFGSLMIQLFQVSLSHFLWVLLTYIFKISSRYFIEKLFLSKTAIVFSLIVKDIKLNDIQ